MIGKIAAVIGAQYGSEGKGVVSNHLAKGFDIHVRTGGPNAGHTFSREGQEFKLQCLPCGWTNLNAELFLGAGAVVNPTVLLREIELLKGVGVDLSGRLYIDQNATCLSPTDEEQEGHIFGEIHQRIGSTGEGVGAARVSRINRDPSKTQLLGDYCREHHPDLVQYLSDTADQMHARHASGANILLEGTQGHGLSCIHGPWPYVTSADTGAAQLCADAGLPPQWVTNVILVARTFPIRVAGNSGTLRNETSWDFISLRVGKATEERTTVTDKVRRVGRWDHDLFGKAVRRNAPTEVVLTFMDYLDPSCSGETSRFIPGGHAETFIGYVERSFAVDVSLVGTGYSPTGGWTHVSWQR